MTTISLMSNDKVVWTLEVISNEFIAGFLYGGLFILKQLPNHHFIIQYAFSRVSYNNVDELQNNFSSLRRTHIPLYEAQILTADVLSADHYIFWLRDPDFSYEGNLVSVKSLLFLQGLFTALHLARIPYERVLLHKPIRDHITYSIKELQLPDLKNIILV